MGMAIASGSFCRVCGTEHDGPANCPGELRATGAERPGWRIQVQTPLGQEAIGVLLAPSHDQWRARIVTYPNVLWSAPGGRGTLKFVGETAAEAEALAIRFIEEHVRKKRYQRREGSAPVGASGVLGITRATPERSQHVAAVPRKPRSLPVRFGIDRANLLGTTVNLSAEGMFVRVPTPEDEGQSIRIFLELDGHTLPLRGVVMWSRRRAEPERPAGMGVRLSEPPALYRSFVASLP